MRILLSLTLFLAIVGGLNAQSDTTINGATFKANGNVGIGVNDPENVLSVGGGSSFRDGTSLDMVFGKPAGKNGIVFNIKEYPGYSRFNMINNPNDTPSKRYLLLSYNSHPGLSISQTGFVGIGTTTPLAKLHVLSGGPIISTFQQSNINGADAGIKIKGSRNGSTTSDVSFIDFANFDNNEGPGTEFNMAKISAGMGSASGGTGYLRFYTNSGRNLKEAVRILSNGNVGIGTTTPLAKFHVLSGSPIISTFQQSNISGADAGIKIRGSRNGSTTSDVSFIDFANFDNNEGSGTEFNMAKISAGMGSASGGTGYLRFYTNSGRNLKEAVRILSNGNVGIGVSDPDVKLVVDGTVRSEEVKVEVVNAPDYVFSADYDVISIEDVESYIKEHSHLPEIPSAIEMEGNGIDLGVMNMRLLKKIEELTLYAIDQEKRLERQEEELAVLREKKVNIDDLKDQLLLTFREELKGYRKKSSRRRTKTKLLCGGKSQ